MKSRMKRAALVAAFGLSLAAGGPAWAEDETVATLGSESIKASEIKDFIASLNPAQRQAAAKDPAVMTQLVRTAIGRKVVLKEANKQSWQSKPEVAAQIERTRQDIIISSYLQSVSTPPASFPSDQELHQVYDQNKDRLMSPPEYHLAQIFFAVSPTADKDASAAVERKAKDMAKKAKAKGADFAELARGNSEEKESAAKGGDLGWLSETQILPGILASVRIMGEKGVSEPIRTTSGWHVVQVIGIKPTAQRPFVQVRDELVTAMRQTKTNQDGQAYAEKLMADQGLKLNDTVVKSLFAATK
jgi:parvulin-like peptidyl-prolyl isomerase